MFKDSLSNILRAISKGLNVPVMIILICLIACAIILVGQIVMEFFTERRRLKVKLPALVDKIAKCDEDILAVQECIEKSGLLRRQKWALLELTNHPELTNVMREALAIRLMEEEKTRFERIVKRSDLVAKLGPMFGLLGTLIPLGPGIVALGQGDTRTLSSSLLTAFDTTVAGLSSAAVAMVVSAIRKSWYKNYMSILETLMDCVLEVTNHERA